MSQHAPVYGSMSGVHDRQGEAQRLIVSAGRGVDTISGKDVSS